MATSIAYTGVYRQKYGSPSHHTHQNPYPKILELKTCEVPFTQMTMTIIDDDVFTYTDDSVYKTPTFLLAQVPAGGHQHINKSFQAQNSDTDCQLSAFCSSFACTERL